MSIQISEILLQKRGIVAMQTVHSKTKNMQGKKNNPVVSLVVIFAVMISLFVIFNFITGGKFLTVSNVAVIFSHAIYPTFIAWGLVFLFACNYTDLSIGGVLVIGAFAVNMFGNWWGYPGVIFGGVAVGAILVFINFTIFAYAKIPSWIAGIALAMIYEASAVALKVNPVTKPLVDVQLSENFRALGVLPYSALILVVGFIVAYIIYNKTTIGLNIRAMGSNAAVSKALGINIPKTLLAVGVICGVFIGIASFLQESYIAQMQVKTGLTSMYLVFQPIATVLLAQIMQKKINIITAVPICAFIIFSIFNLLTILGIPSGTLQEAVLGFFVIAFGMIGQKGVKGVIK